ncbi:MAG: serine/threonine protein kinase [Deltaproteobacteria bacterium]|nr:serine/threonine protein kinase [Deltaproteobacteria bacterium]
MSTEPAGLMHAWSTRGIDVAALAPDSKGTLHHGDETLAAPPPPGVIDEAWPETIELGPVLGAGGMGVVRAGVQTALRRSVAVKELRAEHAHPGAIAGLLREAWVSGNLEHPNVVPVHALVPGDAGPRLVMKRVEGTEWSRLIHDAPDLSRDLGILDRLCHALHFAHARGVLHLDLKPHNVMIGSFGEVYLVDWGLAVARDDDGPPWLPRASAIKTVCGTPAYISPEAACGDGPGIDHRTDVYGLGAMLHEVLTRRGRHEGPTMIDTLVAAFASEPFDYGPDVPRELAAIANRATARHPDDRFPDAEAFRKALEAFVAHRSASRLTEDAERRLARIVALVASTRASGRGTMGEADVERRFGECRLAFEQALALWPESPEARAGKRRLTVAMVEHALALRDTRRAVAGLAELDPPDPDLVARVDALRAERVHEAAHVARLRELGHESDVDTNHASRSKMALICGLMWLGWNLGSALVVKSWGLELVYEHLFASAGATIALCVVALWLYRDKVATTAINRGILGLFAVFFGVIVLFWLGAWQLGLTPLQAIAASNSIYLCYALAITFFVDRRALGPALAIAPATPLAMAWPELAFEIAALVGGTLALWLAWIWRRPATAPVRGLSWAAWGRSGADERDEGERAP